ncbi:hypothetical protein BC827DRAFT_1275299 [Russula dissimulans]|nr:hypothetical protein BC827DRAFT_1275299 [Russula dissimulans]
MDKFTISLVSRPLLENELEVEKLVLGLLYTVCVMGHLDPQDTSLATGARTPLGRSHEDEETST